MPPSAPVDSAALSGPYHEMVGADGTARPAWTPVWAYLNTHSNSQLAYARSQVQRELAEQEITASVYETDAGSERLWDLDSLPFVLASDEWQWLCSQLQKRAQVLECFLQDLYGEARLLRQRWFPQQLAYEHPGFLRPVIGHAPATFLHCYAADLIRDPSGEWRVLSDRCQAPFGLGYALQNRLVIGRSLPDLFQQTGVQALAPFFHSLTEHLRQLTSQAVPRVVLLGMPDKGEANYEQAFLSRFLDVDFVSADDLTVRDRRLFLKTLGGLIPVDVCLRFVDDGWCDPLLLRADSTVGVPGLADAVAAGNVILANALGSGLADSPAWMSYIPRLAEFFKLDPGALRGVDSVWCGDAEHRSAVEAALDERVLLSAWYGLRQRPLLPFRAADTSGRNEIRRRLQQHPAAYAAIHRQRPSIAPAWDKNLLTHHGIVLRMFFHANAAGGYIAMPGGLIRCSPEADFAYHGIRYGGTSKDLWIPTLLDQVPASAPATPYRLGITERRAEDLPSSLLDDLFWFGRTCETLDHLARLLRVSVQIQRAVVLGERAQTCPVVDALCDLQAGSSSPRTGQQRLDDLIGGKPPALSLRGQLGELARLARSTRSHLSGDTWLLVQEIRQQFGHSNIDNAARFTSIDRLAVRVLANAEAIAGTLAENMLHDHSWTFVQIGRRLQRALQLAQLLSTCQQYADEADDLLSIMGIADSAVTWRTRYSRPPQAEDLIGMLGERSDHPRSLAFQLVQLDHLLATVPGSGGIGDPLPQLLESARAALASRQLPAIASSITELATGVDHRWFSHALPARSVDRSQLVP